MFKNALVSVSDKTGLAEFLKPFVDQGLRIVSSGGTAKYLREKGFEVTSVSDQTKFPEVMGGRVKTLHPNIHMPLLCRTDNPGDMETLKDNDLDPFDLVIVNLYPFAQGLDQDKSEDEMVELIDIGGPTLLRAAAKNFKSVCVVCDPTDYEMVANKKEVTLVDRKHLAAKVFGHVSKYDSLITQYLSNSGEDGNHHLQGELKSMLRYGENPQQKGYWYHLNKPGLHNAQIIQGKPLSYNNLLDLDAACRSLALFNGPTVVSVKHCNPCGVASAGTVSEALSKSLKADPVSVFGGIIASNETIDAKCAEDLTSLFLECVVAPDFDDEAYKILSKKKNLRVLKWPELANLAGPTQDEFRTIWGGYLVQSQDEVNGMTPEWQFMGHEPTPDEIKEIEFAWKVCSTLKSNAIAVTSSLQSVGLGMGQVNRVDAVKQALERTKEFHPNSGTLYLASDAFFPFPDSVELAAKAGVNWIIQPGGSIKDDEVIEAAKNLNVKMVFTRQRHFRH